MRRHDPNDPIESGGRGPAPTLDRTIRTPRSRTRAFNEALAEVTRSMNEQLRALRYSSMFNEYLCECGRKSCHEAIPLALDEYMEIRKTRSHFLIVRGHEPPGTRVARETPRYVVVERLTAGP